MPSASNNIHNIHRKIRRLPTQIFIGAYQGVTSASEVERVIADEEYGLGSVVCTSISIFTRDIAGKTTYRNTGNPAALHAAASGAIRSGLVGSTAKLVEGTSSSTRLVQLAGDPSVPERTKALAASQQPSVVARVAKHHIEASSSWTSMDTAMDTAMDVVDADSDRDAEHDASFGEAISASLTPGSSAILCVLNEVLVTQKDYDENLELRDYRKDMDDLKHSVASAIAEQLRAKTDVAFRVMVDEASGDVWWKRWTVATGEQERAIQIRDVLLGQNTVATTKDVSDDDNANYDNNNNNEPKGGEHSFREQGVVRTDGDGDGPKRVLRSITEDPEHGDGSGVF